MGIRALRHGSGATLKRLDTLSRPPALIQGGSVVQAVCEAVCLCGFSILDHVLALNLALCKAIEFPIRVVLPKEIRREDNDAETAPAQTFLNLHSIWGSSCNARV
ncbi:MAG: hypothetical protein GY854_34800 [Deltaproteobacteria bacterium]|nr:hypothetical protein [Deltaproteobacteria bacterium]